MALDFSGDTLLLPGVSKAMSHEASKRQIVSLFPTPILIVRSLLTLDEIEAAKSFIYGSANQPNSYSSKLNHTDIFVTDAPPIFSTISEALMPQIMMFSGVLFGEPLEWIISGMWGNIGRENALQRRHNHANSMISGIVYLTEQDQAGTTRFHRPTCDLNFSLESRRPKATCNLFNSTTWSLDKVQPGDALIFPSSLTHDVTTTAGPDRLTVAFNALPTELECSGYIVRFEKVGRF